MVTLNVDEIVAAFAWSFGLFALGLLMGVAS